MLASPSMLTSDAWPCRVLGCRTRALDPTRFKSAIDVVEPTRMVALDAFIDMVDCPMACRDAVGTMLLFEAVRLGPLAAKSSKKFAAPACTRRQFGGRGVFNALCTSHNRRLSDATSTPMFFANVCKWAGCTGFVGEMSPWSHVIPVRNEAEPVRVVASTHLPGFCMTHR